MQTNLTRTANPALRQGLIFGIGLGILLAIIGIVSSLTGFGSIVLSIILLVVELAAYAIAGYFASAQTGRVGTGALAGLYTGLFSAIISSIVSLIFTFVALDAARQRAITAAGNTEQARQLITNQFLITSLIIGVIVGLVLAIGLGAGLGAIGGALGKNRAPLPQQSYQESMYQGLPPTPSSYQPPVQNQPYPPYQPPVE